MFTISKKDKILKGEITLTASKSESNRVLIIRALCGKHFPIHNLAAAKDTSTLDQLLELSTKGSGILDAGPAGTTFRFLTAYLALQPGTFTLTGSRRMQERPVGILIDALRKLGAGIKYTEKEGYPPLEIFGKKLKGGSLTIDGSISSQFITALLLIAPKLENGLQLTITGEVSSRPYIEMTLKIMNYFGVKSNWEGNTITVNEQNYLPKEYTVEGDWSAASYWYEMAAFADEADITLHGLNKDSLQGDSKIAEIMETFGVKTSFDNGKIVLSKSHISYLISPVSFDFSSCPDLAQTVAVTAAGLGVKATLSGLHSLRIKETDRIAALQNELQKFGSVVNEIAPGTIEVIPSHISHLPSHISTYDDHRMAMAFAPLAMIAGSVKIENPGVVEKSYPDYWRDLEKLGFEIKD